MKRKAHRDDLLGTYVPGRSLLHRCPLALKAVLILGSCLTVMVIRAWRFSLAVIVLTALASVASGLGLHRWVASLRPLLFLVLLLGGYHLIFNGPARAASVVLSLVAVVNLSRLLISTTPLPRLIDGLVWLCTPLSWCGVSTERIGLAVSLMIRSVPWLFGCLGELRDAATARTIRVNPVRLVTPATIATVHYAHQTGEALAARGLD